MERFPEWDAKTEGL